MNQGLTAPCHLELAFDDTKRGQQFYTNVFGWKYKKYETQNDMGYWSVDFGNDFKPVQIYGMGIMKRMGPDHRVVMYINVDDIATYENKVKEHGGSLVGQRVTLPKMGHFHFFKDTEGNLLSLWQNDKNA